MTKLFGVVGHPIAHSLSPVMFESALKADGIDARFEKFDVEPEKLGEFLDEVRGRGISGLSVTIPHKQAVMAFLDDVDKVAGVIGAVNTIANNNGKLVGFNTDWLGFKEALKEMDGEDLAGKKAVVLGAGGAADAVVYALVSAGASATILNRTVKKAAELVERFLNFFPREKIQFDTLDKIGLYQADILVNTTSVGMKYSNGSHNYIEESPVPDTYFVNMKPEIAFDVVYTPMETKFVKQAEAAGVKTIFGYKMLLHQGAHQFKIWFKEDAPIQLMEKTLITALNGNNMAA